MIIKKEKSKIRFRRKFILAIVLVFTLLFGLLHFTFFQTWFLKQVTNRLSKVWKTEVSIGKAKIAYFSYIELEDFLLRDMTSDTLVFISKIDVSISKFAPFNRAIAIEKININGVLGKIVQGSDGIFNFSFMAPPGPSTNSTSNTKPWTIDINDVILEQSNLFWSSKSSNYDLTTYIDKFKCTFKTFDLTSQIVEVNLLKLDKSRLRYVAGPGSHTKNESAKSNTESILPKLGWQIAIKQIEMGGNEFVFHALDQTKETEEKFLDFKNMDWSFDTVAVLDFIWQDDQLAANLDRLKMRESNGYKIEQCQSKIQLRPKELHFTDLLVQTPQSIVKNSTTIRFDDSFNLQKELNLVWVTSNFLNCELIWQDLSPFLPSKLSRHYKFLPVDSRIRWNGKIEGNVDQIDLDALQFEAGRDVVLEVKGQIRQLMGDQGPIFALKLDKGMGDYYGLQKWMPMVKVPAGLKNLGKIKVQGQVYGSMSDLSLSPLIVRTEKDTRLNAKISVKGFPDLKKLRYMIELDSLFTRYNDWAGFLPERDPISQLDSLGLIFYNGTLSGNANGLWSAGDWNTELGNIKSKLDLKFESDVPSEYQMRLNISDWNVAPLLSTVVPVNRLSGSVELDGSGMKIPEMNIAGVVIVDSIAYKDYVYQNLIVDIQWKDQIIDSKISISDPNLMLEGNGKFELADSVSLWQFVLTCDTFLPHHLHLTKQPYDFSGKVIASVEGKTMETMTGMVNAYDLRLVNDSLEYLVDSVKLSRLNFGGEQKILLRSGNQLVSLAGMFSLDDLPQMATHFKNNFRPKVSTTGIQDIEHSNLDSLIDNPFRITLYASLTDLDTILHLFVPSWKGLDSFVLSGNWDNGNQAWDLSASAGSAKHANGSFKKLFLNGSGVKDTAVFNIQIDSLLFPDQEDYFNVSWVSNLKNDRIKSQLLWENDNGERMIEISPILNYSGDRLLVSFDDTLRLANKAWIFSRPHQILVGRDLLYFDQIELARGDRRIKLHSQSLQSEPTEHILTLRDFPLEDISSILNLKHTQFKGKANGVLKAQNIKDGPVFTTNLDLNQLEYNQHPLGNFGIDASYLNNDETVLIQSQLVGANAFQATGHFNPFLKTADLIFSIDSIQCNLLEEFTWPHLQKISGLLKGFVHVTGAFGSPEVEAEISLVRFRSFIDYLKGEYHIPNHTFRISQKEIEFGDMVLFDAKNQPAQLGGTIKHKHFQRPEFDLNFQTDHFQFLNTNSDDNNLFYGQLFLGMAMQFRGRMHRPVATINAVTLPETNVYFVSPSSEELAIDQANYIIYGKPELIPTGSNQDAVVKPLRYVADTSGIDLFLNLEVNPNSSITIILDPETGDKLTCQGEAQISVAQDASESFQVKGNYVVKTGEYQLNYENIFKRNFKIQPESEMIFVGDLKDTRFKISATYMLKTNLVDLIKHEAVMSSEESFLASERREVNVIMHLSGSLSMPKITFDIQLTDQKQDAINTAAKSKLDQLREQESELNTQVFGLLLFNSFISRDRSSTSLSERGEAIILSSVSSFITGQLNRLADRIGGGINLRFDVDSYRGGSDTRENTITEVQLGLTKQMFNNRLSIDVGGNLDVYSHRGGSITDFTTLAGDFVLSYILDDSGSYRLKVFRRSNFDIISDSSVHRTGVGISFDKAFKQKRRKRKE